MHSNIFGDETPDTWGFEVDEENNVISKVYAGGQAEEFGMRPGWSVVQAPERRKYSYTKDWYEGEWKLELKPVPFSDLFEM